MIKYSRYTLICVALMYGCMFSSTLFTKMNYSLIEIKLRRFIYLGHTNSIYVQPTIQKVFWKNEKHHYELNGVKLIQKIIEKNNTEDIESIVPIILKIEKEKKLQNYEYLMYILAVCAKFQKHECLQMVTDVYAAVRIICTDGLKLLMFYAFCNTAAKVLQKQGYIPKKSLGYGSGARKTFRRWYLDRNPLETISSIVKQKSFRGFSHKNIMNTIHLNSKDPSHQIYILYIRFGISRMEKVFGKEMREVNDSEQIKSLMEPRFIYNYIRQVHRINFEIENKLISNLKWNILGKDFKQLLPKMLQSTKILTSFVWHFPLTTLLENTYAFHRHGFFKNLLGNHGCMEYIYRFNNHIEVKESGIHPIDAYLEFLKYQRYGAVIRTLKENRKNDQVVLGTPVDEQKYFDDLELKMEDEFNEYELIKSCKMLHNNIDSFFLKPVPCPVPELQTFLSIDLVKKTLKNLQPTGRRLLIGYDNRMSMESVTCEYTHVKFVKVLDAIVLIIQSLVYQEKFNKPTICGLFDPLHRFKFIKFNYKQKFTVHNFRKCLFEELPNNSKNFNKNQGNRPLSIINWARKKEENNFDVFLFLGTTGMNLKGIRKTKANYEEFTNSKIKIIICCLNGKHYDRENISRDGMLYIYGFDKNTARMINLFINNTF